MHVTRDDLRRALVGNGLAARPVCVHGSLCSFGHVEGGPTAIVDAFLDEGCTLLVPTFSWSLAVPPRADQRFRQNGWDYDNSPGPTRGLRRCYTPGCRELDKEMGAIAAAALARADAVRGDHPLNSFAAIGPLAVALAGVQRPLDVYAPLQALADLDGSIVLMCVGFTSLTLLHLAEKRAGRNLFRRWANDGFLVPMPVEVGGCSNGFGKLEEPLRRLLNFAMVGESKWTCLPAGETLAMATAVIRDSPRITCCDNPRCERCADAIRGGPRLEA